VVLCIDEKSQIQAFDVRHGVTSLFAALEVATGNVTGRCFDRHREFLAFLKLVARRHPRRELHVVLDNYGTHKPPQSAAGWTPTAGSAPLYADLGELDEPGRDVLRALTRQAIRRDTSGTER
jgi:hypothetical protein